MYLVSATEMWERFSYYSIAGLLPLLLTSLPADGGFGWGESDAVRLVGLYSGLVFAAPGIGGWISSRYLAEQRSISLGGFLIVAGQLGLLAALVTTNICFSGYTNGVSSLQLGHLFVSGEVLEQAGKQLAMDNFGLLYRVQAFIFVAGLGLTAIGTGLLKPAISSIVGMLYADGDNRAEAGFSIFMAGIWIGAFFAKFVSGTVGETYGWMYGVATAAIGMSTGLLFFTALKKPYLGNRGLTVARQRGKCEEKATIAIGRAAQRRLFAFSILSGFTIVYSVAFYQMFGVLNLLIRNDINRLIGNFEVPATWFLSISTASFVIFIPITLHWFAARCRKGKAVDVAQKSCMGLILLGVAFLILTHAVPDDGTVQGGYEAMLVVAVAYILFGVADVFIWPAQIATASAVAPKHLASFIIGAWYVAIGVGSYLSGLAGSLILKIGIGRGLLATAMVLFLSATAVLLLRPILIREMSQFGTAAQESRTPT